MAPGIPTVLQYTRLPGSVTRRSPLDCGSLLPQSSASLLANRATMHEPIIVPNPKVPQQAAYTKAAVPTRRDRSPKMVDQASRRSCSTMSRLSPSANSPAQGPLTGTIVTTGPCSKALTAARGTGDAELSSRHQRSRHQQADEKRTAYSPAIRFFQADVQARRTPLCAHKACHKYKATMKGPTKRLSSTTKITRLRRAMIHVNPAPTATRVDLFVR